MFNGITSGVPAVYSINDGNGNNNGNGMWGGDFWAWIVVLLIFGWGGFGNGFGGFGGGAGAAQAAYATQADLQRGFDTQSIISKLDGINNGICSLGYDQLAQMNGINTNIMQTGFGITNALQANAIAGMQQSNALQAQLQDCCCENRAAIAQVRYDMATDTCAITTAVNQGFAQLDRTINDKFCELQMRQMQQTIDEQQSLIQSLNLAQSQANQNQYLVDKLRPCPTPAYLTCNPWASNGTAYTNAAGYGYYNNGCGGCGCNAA